VSYLLAVLGLAAVCVLWYGVQRWAGTLGRVGCHEAEPDCDDCDLGEVDSSGRCTPRLIAQVERGGRGSATEK
jgi:hypothetical protein